ncbi:MAG TPA: hypothetical protein VK404_01445, partial [Spirosoma sp.]|nr:hypothetical protein [Spirosoma sp.]
MKNVITFVLLCLSIGTRAQSVNLVAYQELPDPKPLNKSSWLALKPGQHVSFASIDVRYEKHTAPAIHAARTTWNTKAWKGEKVHQQILIWSRSALPKTSLTWSDLKNNKGNTIPASLVSARFVRYVMTDGLSPQGGGCDERPTGKYDSSLVADP